MVRFTPQFLDEIRDRLRASDVIGRSVKLRKEGREYRGLSPFTNEKTPSFYVNDEKGRFYDFSSGKQGDIIGFMMETQRMAFPEAVEHLAELAGVPLPKETKEDARRAEEAKTLAEASVEAARYFRTMLGRAEGREALAYLNGRGVSDQARASFGLGYAPPSRTALRDYLVERGFSLDVLVEAGLLIRPDDGGAPYDRFRHRVMFPILSSGGRVIAFGGRALSKDVAAKYLNSPETPLFHKSATLYNLPSARKLAGRDGRPLLVAEGYMDVIALASAGYAAVAPLGTALTEQQIQMMWRVVDTPILCFDGDRAGRSAAFRAIDRAMPLLTPDKSLRFAFLPDGQDPDDLLRTEGGAAEMTGLVENAAPMADTFFAHEAETRPRATPEEVAGFRRHLRERIRLIADADVRAAYGEFVARKLQSLDGGTPQVATRGWDATRGAQPPRLPGRTGQKGWRGAPPLFATDALKSKAASLIKQRNQWLTEAVLVLTLIHQPALFFEREDDVFDLDLTHPQLDRLLKALIEVLTSSPDLDSGDVATHILSNSTAADIYSHWIRDRQIEPLQFVRPDAPPDLARKGWLNALSKYRAANLEPEVADAALRAHRSEDDLKTWRDTLNYRSRLMSEHKPDESTD